MISARPYYLLGQKQLQQLAERAQAALAPLAGRWWSADCNLRIEAVDNFYRDDTLHGATARYFAQSGQCWLALFGSEWNWLALAEGWLGCKVATISELVRTLLREFSSDIFCALAESSTAPELNADVAWAQLPEGIAAPGAGTVRLTLMIDGVALQMLASPTLWPALAEVPSARARNKLTPCNAALGDCRVRLSATLPVAQIPLTDIAALAVGDFLNLGHDLSGRALLRGDNIQLELPALVGRRQNRKAIQLTASTAPSMTPSKALQHEKNT